MKIISSKELFIPQGHTNLQETGAICCLESSSKILASKDTRIRIEFSGRK